MNIDDCWAEKNRTADGNLIEGKNLSQFHQTSKPTDANFFKIKFASKMALLNLMRESIVWDCK